MNDYRPFPFKDQPAHPSTTTITGPGINPYRGHQVAAGFSEVEVFLGMTTRDEFAARALQGLLAETFTPGTEATASVINEASCPNAASAADHYARAAYKLADAMLKARES